MYAHQLMDIKVNRIMEGDVLGTQAQHMVLEKNRLIV